MELSCLPVSYYKEIINKEMSISDWAKESQELGLDSISVSIKFLENRDTDYLKEFHNQITDHGMHISMVSTYSDFTNPDPVKRKREEEELKLDIIACSSIGADYIRVTAGQAHPETTRGDGTRWTIEHLLRMSAFAEDYNIKLLFENHAKPGFWDYTDFSQPLDIFLEIVEGIKGSNIGINFDTANPLASGYNPLDVLNKLIPYGITSIHASDNGSSGKMDPVVIGTGMVPFTDIFAKLKSISFNGAICIEEASGTGKSGIEYAVKFIRSAWEII